MSTQHDRSPTPPRTPDDASPTPSTPSTPFDPDTLPPPLRAKLDRISAIRWRILEIIDRQRAARLAAEAEAARAAKQNDEAAGAADSQRSAT
jgi:hypothetical protein